MKNFKSKIQYFEGSACYVLSLDEDCNQTIFDISTEVLNEYTFVEVENYYFKNKMCKRAIWHKEEKKMKKYIVESDYFEVLQMLRNYIADYYPQIVCKWGGRWNGLRWEHFIFSTTEEINEIERQIEDDSTTITEMQEGKK